MRISVFGLGYVGIVTATCLADDGHTVTGVDIHPGKVELVNDGKSPIVEPGLGAKLQSAVSEGRLLATVNTEEAVDQTEISLICVGTPSADNGDLNLAHVRQVCREIGAALSKKDGYHTVVMRSTALPGSLRDTVVPELERASGKNAGKDFAVCNNPEFLREGSAIHDFLNPPKTVVGEFEAGAADPIVELYRSIDAPLVRTSVEIAELVKYVDNTWHALKVAFGNEVGRICKSLGIDSHEVMDIFLADRKLNISPAYLTPGFAYGGSCLPKDLRALSYLAARKDVSCPIIGAISDSNDIQIASALKSVLGLGAERLGLLGLSFKAGTDDLRESPLVELVERLIGKGFDIRIYDRNVNLANLVGTNRDYLMTHIPHIAQLFVDSAEAAIQHGDAIIVGNHDKSFADALDKAEGKRILDLVRIFDSRKSGGLYQGLSW